MYRLALFVFIISTFFLSSCKPPKPQTIVDSNGKELIHVTLETDWYAQPEHGGYYEALVKGYYAEEGLDVEIIPGGMNCAHMEKTAMREIDFSIGRSDDVIVRIGRGLPITIIGIEMQHDPTAVFSHPSQNLKSLSDLNGRNVKAGVGMAWTHLLKHRLNINFVIVPSGNGLGEFLQDETLLQQGFATNEPFFIRKEGYEVNSLLIYEANPETYRVMITSNQLAKKHPDLVLKFVRATLKGWRSFLTEDPTKTFERIVADNPLMQEPGFMEFSRNALIEHRFVADGTKPDSKFGKISLNRVQKEIEALNEIEFLDRVPSLEEVVHIPTFSELGLLEEAKLEKKIDAPIPAASISS